MSRASANLWKTSSTVPASHVQLVSHNLATMGLCVTPGKKGATLVKRWKVVEVERLVFSLSQYYCLSKVNLHVY